MSTTQKGAAIGGLGGAAAGGLVGSAVRHPVAGALVGGALGAGGGALIGNQLQGHEEVQQQQQEEINRESSEVRRQREELQRIKKQGEYWYSPRCDAETSTTPARENRSGVLSVVKSDNASCKYLGFELKVVCLSRSFFVYGAEAFLPP
jgi:uncharacterized protein YcfJ